MLKAKKKIMRGGIWNIGQEIGDEPKLEPRNKIDSWRKGWLTVPNNTAGSRRNSVSVVLG